MEKKLKTELYSVYWGPGINNVMLFLCVCVYVCFLLKHVCVCDRESKRGLLLNFAVMSGNSFILLLLLWRNVYAFVCPQSHFSHKYTRTQRLTDVHTFTHAHTQTHRTKWSCK